MGYELNRRVVSVLNLSDANIIQKYSKIAKYFPKFKSYHLFHTLLGDDSSPSKRLCVNCFTILFSRISHINYLSILYTCFEFYFRTVFFEQLFSFCCNLKTISLHFLTRELHPLLIKYIGTR